MDAFAEVGIIPSYSENKEGDKSALECLMAVKPLVSSVKAGEGRNSEERMSVMGMRWGFASLFAEPAAAPMRGSAGVGPS